MQLVLVLVLVLVAPASELSQVQLVRLAGQAALAGEEPLCVPKTCATWVDASTGSRRLSAVSGTSLAMLA
jgi:hypothetical protein